MHEVIVVGAGPAGSIAAALLAQYGRRVLLLDKATFPRSKVCGDGISNRAIEELEKLGVWPTVQFAHFYPTHRVRSIAPNGDVVDIELPTHTHRGGIAPRKTFDSLLKTYATTCGAEFCLAEVVEPIVVHGRVQGVVAQINGELQELRANVVIAADGAYSVLAKYVRQQRNIPLHRYVAIRGYVETEHEQMNTTVIHYLRALLPGYAWMFPIAPKVVNVGIGTTEARCKTLPYSLKSLFHHYLTLPQAQHQLGTIQAVHDVQGGVLNLGGYENESRVYPGLLLVGDAGAFINPVTGGGIASALITGRLAAEVTDEALDERQLYRDILLEHYDRRWRKELLPLLRRAYMVQQLLLHHEEPINLFNWLAKTIPPLGYMMNDVLESFA